MYDNLFLSKLFAIVFAFFFFSIQLKQLVNVAFTVLAAKHFGLKCDSVSLFGLLLKKHDDKWEYVKGKPTLICNAGITLDLSLQQTPEQIDRNEKLFSIIQRIILVILSILFVFLFRGLMIDGLTLKGNILEVFAAYFAFGMCFHTLASIFIYFYTFQVAMKKLGGYYGAQIKKIRSGEKIASLDLKPIDQLGFDKPTKAERGMYNTLYATYLIASGRTDELAPVAHELHAQYSNSEYLLAETGAYYFLIFYYSRYELNPTIASHYLKKCAATISADKDSNGKRVLAYYAFGIEQDFAKSRALLNEAFAVIEKFSIGDERELERKLLWELDGFLKENGY